MNDIIINKIQSIQRCIKRAREEYNKDSVFQEDFSAQDAAILNIVRACELSIDLANHLIKKNKWGIPNSSADSFLLLRQQSVIDSVLAGNLVKVVGFRNIVIHEYQKIDLSIVEKVINYGLDDLIRFSDAILSNIEH